MRLSCFRGILAACFALAGCVPAVLAGTPDAVDDTVTVRKDTKTDINVRANDTGTSFGPGVVSVTQPANGTAKIVAGKVQYTPNPGYTGADSFTYTVRDGVKFGYVQRSPVRFVTSAENGGDGDVTVQASGWGSAMAPGLTANQFYLLTDRGPNADGTNDTNKTFPVPDFNPKLGLFERQGDGTFALKQTINLKRPDGTLITGLPNPVNTSGLETASLVGGGAVTLTLPGSMQGQDVFGLDPEGLAFVSDGFWVSDEYGPQLVKFDTNGVEQERLNPFSFNTQGRKIPRILGERRPNRGMEGLCVTPSGKLVGIMQSALKINNAGTGQSISNGNNNKTPVLRILRYDPATGAAEQFIYVMDNTNMTNQMRVSEIACINEDKFLVLERDDSPPVADGDGTGNGGGPYKIIYEIDLTKSLDSSGAVDAGNPPTDVNGGRDQGTGALIPYTPGDADGDPGTATNKVKQWKRASDNAINTLEVLCQSQTKAQTLTILHALQNPVTSGAEPVRPVAKTVFFNYFTELSSAYPHTKTEGIVILERNMAGDTATKIALVNDDDFGMDAEDGGSNTIKTNINANGVQSFNEIVEVDVATTSTDTATVNITVENQTPQITAVANGVVVKPIFTVGDSVNRKLDGVTPYRFVGIPDGLGAFNNADGTTFTLAMAHELGSSEGTLREHGSKGAFVSRWVINRTTLQVTLISDHNPTPKSVFTTTNGNGTVGGTAQYGRFCSADLPAVTAFFNAGSGKGTSNRIFMGGEEAGAEGRAFGHVLTGPTTGNSYELPHLGKFSWENAIACPKPQDKTIVIGTDDSSPGQVYMYVGEKRTTGNEVEKAGLVGGKLYGVRANSKAAEDRNTAVGSAKDAPVPFTLVDLGDVSAQTGAQLQTASTAGGVTEFLRPEDGAWDPNNPSDFYFVTTDRFDQIKNVSIGTQVGRSRLWRLRFSNIAQPELGGTITMLIDGSENPGPNMMDNMCVDNQNRVIITEDIGGQAPSGKIWSYSLLSGKLTLIAKHNPALFGDVTESAVTLPVAGFNNDEESSGIFDATEQLGSGWYLVDVQAHVTANDTELVQKGQLLAIFIPSSVDADSPSNSTPYMVPVANGVQTKAIFTVGETANLKPDGITPYRMVGIPDGLGAFDNNDGTFTLTIGHELGNTLGAFRAHGSKGAFVSVWNINKSTLQVNSIQDHNPNTTSIFTSTNGNGTVAGTANYGRFCSADLPVVTAFFNPNNGKGTSARIFMNGEETGNEGRAFAHIITGANAGTSHELPRLGKFSWENSIACPLAQDKTIVIGTDDSSPGQVYVYVGTKGTSGTDVDKAGLTNGVLYGVLANGTAVEDRTTGVGLAKGVVGQFILSALNDVSGLTGAQLDTNSGTAVTKFLRPEDGAWDPNNPADFYFVTTDRFDQVKNGGTGTQVGRSRLWRLRFNNIASPDLGGTVTMLLDGSEDPGPNMMDNMAVDRFGRILLQEDPGGQAHSARIWMYTIATGSLTEIAKHDPARFGEVVSGVVTAATAPFNNDEESSGILDAGSLLGDGWYLLDVQAHVANPDTELVERGQLLALFVPTVLPPSISAIANQVTNEDTATGAISFSVTAGSFAITSVTAVSSNTTLVPDASAVIAGTGANRTITLTPAQNQNGVTTITVTATDAGGQTATTSFTLTVQPVADVPVVTSMPTATPNPAKKGQVVNFSLIATGATAIEWNFGDGTPIGTGASVTHAYGAAGIFTATVKLTGLDGTSTFTVNVVVVDTTAPDNDFDGDGLANSIDPDDDNDGYSDLVEAAMGSSSQDSTSTPGGKPAITEANDITPRQVKLSIKLAFSNNGDSLQLAAVLPGVGAPTDAIVDVGGNVQTFTLTKGKSPKDKQKVLGISKEKLSMRLSKVTLAPDFADEGLTNGTFSGEIVNIQVSIISGGKLYKANLSKEYSAKGGKGSVK